MAVIDMVKGGLHINPLRPRIVMIPNEGTGEMVETEEPMNWEDATKVSAVLMLANIFIVFLPKYAFGAVAGDPATFCWDLIVFAGQTFFASFIALTGLSWVSTSRRTNLQRAA